jgi:hypothetical protein
VPLSSSCTNSTKGFSPSSPHHRTIDHGLLPKFEAGFFGLPIEEAELLI